MGQYVLVTVGSLPWATVSHQTVTVGVISAYFREMEPTPNHMAFTAPPSALVWTIPPRLTPAIYVGLLHRELTRLRASRPQRLQQMMCLKS